MHMARAAMIAISVGLGGAPALAHEPESPGAGRTAGSVTARPNDHVGQSRLNLAWFDKGDRAERWGRTSGRNEEPRPADRCRAGRRALVGAAIGGVAAAPLGVKLRDRFSNEGVNGAALEWTVGIAAAVGAVIGWGTCR